MNQAEETAELVTLVDEVNDQCSETPGEPNKGSLIQQCGQKLKEIWTMEPHEPSIGPPLVPQLGEFTKSFKQHRFYYYIMIPTLVLCGVMLLVLYYLNSFGAVTVHGVPESIPCDTNYWGSCGINATNCLPFTSEWTPFRCDPLCSKYKNHWKAIGSGPYRADAQLCHSATHAGVIGQMGGCFLARASGPFVNFTGTTQNGVSSYSWPTFFPKSFEVKSCESSLCTNIQFAIVLFCILFSWLIFLFRLPKWVLFLFLLHTGWWYIALVGAKDTPHGNHWISQVFDTFIPSFAFAYVLYKIGHKAIPSHDYPVDTLLLYIIPCWILVHWNYLTFIFDDIDLSASSLKENSVIGIVIMIVVASIGGFFLVVPQLWYIWQSGKFKIYLVSYVSVIVFLFLIALSLREYFEFHLHHYMIALFGWPIARFNTRPTAFFQAFLLGLFINGGARWGFDGFFDAKRGYSFPLPPDNITVVGRQLDTVTIGWSEGNCTSYLLMMNDYEVYEGVATRALVQLPGTTLEIFYMFCVKCIESGIVGKCSEIIGIRAQWP